MGATIFWILNSNLPHHQLNIVVTLSSNQQALLLTDILMRPPLTK